MSAFLEVVADEVFYFFCGERAFFVVSFSQVKVDEELLFLVREIGRYFCFGNKEFICVGGDEVVFFLACDDAYFLVVVFHDEYSLPDACGEQVFAFCKA